MTRLSSFRMFRLRVFDAIVIGCSLVIALASLSASASAPAAVKPDAPSASASELDYAVYFDGKRVGTHSYRIERSGIDKTVRSEVEMKVKLLFVTVFNYQHAAEERWRDGCVLSVDSRTRVNGTPSLLTVRGDGRESAIRLTENDSIAREADAEGCLRGYAYWDRRLLSGDLINAQTGEVEPGDVSERGIKPLPMGVPVEAEHVELSTRESGRDVQIGLWYDAAGEWLALRTETRGRPLVYLNSELLPLLEGDDVASERHAGHDIAGAALEL